MHRIVPELVIENYRAGRYSGEFPAVGMFLDLSGFSTMTDALMQHGQHGAEVLAGLMHGVFDPLVESIFAYGGKIVGFAGDGIMALYPIQSDAKSTALQALTSAYVIHKQFAENSTRQTVYGEFSIFAKIGLASGSVSWGILRASTGEQATYYFRGTAVDESAHAEHHAKAGDIFLMESIYKLLQAEIEADPFGSHYCFREFLINRPDPNPVTLLPIDLEIARLFMPEEVIVHNVRGEFRQVVNLFMRFPDLSEAQLDGMMSKIFELRNKYGGLLSRTDFGDKGCNMLILWGAPVAYGNDIGRALNFLLDLKSMVDFPITAGVTYYISHAGYLGSSMYEDYTCYGWGVNLASRFMMSAPVGEIWVDDRIARRVSNWFEIEYLNSQSFKGFAAPQKVYFLHKHKPTAEPTYQGELVGRDEELAQLTSFVGPIWENQFAGLLLVSGDAGIGKGRLVHEIYSSKEFEGKTVLWAICQSDQILRQSFNPLRGWLLRYFGISGGQSLEERKRSFDGKLDELLSTTSDPDLARELDRTRSILGALLDLFWTDSLYEQLDPEGRYNNTLLALIALLKAESLRRPVILFIEDLQFIDSDTKEFLARLKRSILAAEQTFPIAMIVTSRRQGASLEKGLIDARINLRGLSREALGHLIEILLGGPVAPELVSLVMDRSEGNPYFAEQIIRYLQDENLIETGKIGWTLVRSLNEDFLPGDVRAVLVARLDQLTRSVRESVQTASVLGRQFEIPLLVHMWREDDLIHQHVAAAEQATVWGPLDDMHYIFSHGLLRDAAYEMQMQARRRELHSLAVDALEHLYSDVKNRYAELAHHAKYAELGSKAQRYYILAGRVAAESYQNYQAIEYYKRALAFTPLNDLKTQFDILMERVEVLHRIGNRTAQLKDLETLEILAAQLKDEQHLAKVEVLYAYYYYHGLSDYHAVIRHSERALNLSDASTNIEIVIDAYLLLSSAHVRLGNLNEAMQMGSTCLKLARDSGEHLQEGRALSNLGLVAIEQNDYDSAQEYLTIAVLIAREIRNTDLEGRALNNLAMSASFLEGDFALARDYFEQAYAIMHERGDRTAEGVGMVNLGYTARMMGDFEAARTYHEQALSIAREMGNRYQEVYALINLSAVTGLRHDVQASIEYAQKALALARSIGDRSAEAWALLYVGHASQLLMEFEHARQAYNASVLIRNELAQPNMATEPMAGLIETALALEDLPTAMQDVEAILTHLAKGGTFEGTEEPLRIYYVCYLALDKIRDPRSSILLTKAVELLDSQVSKLRDELSRQMFVKNVPWRLAIQQIKPQNFTELGS
jgi:class 3 adenylate cyclase/tetratricopeptide (TPR) repeat protein